MEIDNRQYEWLHKKVEEHEKALTEYGIRIMAIEETAKDIKELTLSVREIATNQRHLGDTVGNLVAKLDAVTDEPRKNWSTFKTAIISSIGGAIGTGGLIAIIMNIIK